MKTTHVGCPDPSGRRAVFFHVGDHLEHVGWLMPEVTQSPRTELLSAESPSDGVPVFGTPDPTTAPDLDAEYRELCYLRHFHKWADVNITSGFRSVIRDRYLGPIPEEYQE